MRDSPYRVLGAEVPRMVGREELAARIHLHLNKSKPDHVSVLGPAMYGKSVLLREIARRYEAGRPGYLTSACVDLRWRTPTTDEELRERVVETLAAAFERTWPEGRELLRFDDVSLQERMQLVASELAQTEESVLLVLDGFDDVLANPGITRVVWDGLLRIAAEPVFRYVTGSRQPLRELCLSEESRTSDFWEIFHDSPIVVGCFSDADWSALIEPFAEHDVTVEDGVEESVTHWTGRIPVLTIALLGTLWDGCRAGDTLTRSDVESAAGQLTEKRRQLLAALWEECSAEMKTDLADLTRRELRVREVPGSRLVKLERRGFVRKVGKRIVHGCHLMELFASQEAHGVSGLQRLFGDHELFEQNVRMLLEMRLAQVPVVDPALTGYVEQAIRHLQPEPRHALVWMRSIVDRALDLIWKRELGDSSAIPSTWMEEWRQAGIRMLPDDGHGRVPGERGRQIRLLRYATGTAVSGRSLRRLTKRITKPSALLLEHLQSVGNFGQHQEDVVTRPFAVSVCLSAIALCASLADDLSG